MVYCHLLVFRLVKDIGQAALATVLPVKVGCHEGSCSTVFIGALPTETSDLAVLVNLQHKIKNNKLGFV